MVQTHISSCLVFLRTCYFLILSGDRRRRLPVVSDLQNIFAWRFHRDSRLDDQLHQEAVWVAAAVAVMAAVIQRLIGVFSI